MGNFELPRRRGRGRGGSFFGRPGSLEKTLVRSGIVRARSGDDVRETATESVTLFLFIGIGEKRTATNLE